MRLSHENAKPDHRADGRDDRKLKVLGRTTDTYTQPTEVADGYQLARARRIAKVRMAARQHREVQP
jgi:hypothetical protein